MTLGLITGIISVSEGEKPQMGPTGTSPIEIEVQTAGRRDFLQISQDAAEELAAELTKLLQALRYQ